MLLNIYPRIAEGAKLDRTQEQEELCKVEYKFSDKRGAVFEYLCNSEKEYSDEYVVLPLGYNDGTTLGSGFYMRLACNTTAVRLKNYLYRVDDYNG